MFVKKYFISYGDKNYTNSKIRIKNEAQTSKFFDIINIYSPDDIDVNFKQKFTPILNEKRGGGYWIWKSYFVKKTLDTMNDNDILVYCDSGCSINSNGFQRFQEYINLVNNNEYGIIGFGLVHIEKLWTNSKVFEYFNINYGDYIMDTEQLVGGIIILRKCPHSSNLVNMWYDTLYIDPYLFTDKYNNYKRQSYFKDHRHDQSIFSIIRKKYGFIPLNDETYPYSNTDWSQLDKMPFHAKRICG